MKYLTALLLAVTFQASAEENYISPPKYYQLKYKNDYNAVFILRLHPTPCFPKNPDHGYLSEVIEEATSKNAYGCWRHEAEGIRLFITVNEGEYIDYPVISRESFEGVYE